MSPLCFDHCTQNQRKIHPYEFVSSKCGNMCPFKYHYKNRLSAKHLGSKSENQDTKNSFTFPKNGWDFTVIHLDLLAIVSLLSSAPITPFSVPTSQTQFRFHNPASMPPFSFDENNSFKLSPLSESFLLLDFIMPLLPLDDSVLCMVALSFIRSLCQHLLSASCGSGRVLATGNSEVNLTDKKPCSNWR